MQLGSWGAWQQSNSAPHLAVRAAPEAPGLPVPAAQDLDLVRLDEAVVPGGVLPQRGLLHDRARVAGLRPVGGRRRQELGAWSRTGSAEPGCSEAGRQGAAPHNACLPSPCCRPLPAQSKHPSHPPHPRPSQHEKEAAPPTAPSAGRGRPSLRRPPEPGGWQPWRGWAARAAPHTAASARRCCAARRRPPCRPPAAQTGASRRWPPRPAPGQRRGTGRAATGRRPRLQGQRAGGSGVGMRRAPAAQQQGLRAPPPTRLASHERAGAGNGLGGAAGANGCDIAAAAAARVGGAAQQCHRHPRHGGSAAAGPHPAILQLEQGSEGHGGPAASGFPCSRFRAVQQRSGGAGWPIAEIGAGSTITKAAIHA